MASGAGTATIRWREKAGRVRFAYTPETADPLRLVDVAESLAESGRLDQDGFGTRADWLAGSVDGAYPGALGRLVDALTGPFVVNTATVIFSG